MNLTDITKNLGEVYKEKKDCEKDLEDARQEFFNAATTEIVSKPRKVKIVQFIGELPTYPPRVKDLEAWILEHYPDYIFQSFGTSIVSKKNEKYIYKFLDISLIENPSIKKYTYINPNDETTYIRNVQESSPILDTEKFKNDFPKVWKEISKPIEPSQEQTKLVEDVIKWDACSIVNTEELAKYYWKDRQERDDWPRSIDYNKITIEDQEIMEKYLIPGKKTLRLEIRKTKKEDLEDNEESE